MSLDTALAAELKKSLADAIADAKDKLPGALPQDQYMQSCGMIVAWQQIHDQIDDIVEKLQRS